MRESSKVGSALWRSKAFLGLPDDGRFLFVFCLTSPHQTAAGAFRLPDEYASADLRWTVFRYRDARSLLIDEEFVIFDEETHEFFINGWFKHCPGTNPSHWKSITSAIAKISSARIRDEAQLQMETVQAAIAASKSEPPKTGSVHSLAKTAHLTGGRR